MTRDECLNLWARCDEKRRTELAAGNSHVFAREEAAKIWNAWASGVRAELAELMSCGESLLPFLSLNTAGQEGWSKRVAEWKSSHSERMVKWIDQAEVDFSGHIFRRSERLSDSAGTAGGDADSQSSDHGGHNEALCATSFEKDEVAAYRFYRFVFPGPAQFNSIHFDKPASFSEATFMMPVSFNDTIFEWAGSFENTRFDGEFACRNSRFKMAADFRNSKFRRFGAFYGTVFQKEAWFMNTEFDDDASFTQADLQGFTDFSGAHFEKCSEFRAVAVKRTCSFSSVRFDRVPDFTQAQFESAPRLDNMTIDFDAETGGFWGSVIRRCDESIAARYRELKRLAIQGHDHDLENQFFREEQRAYRSASCSPWPWKEGWSRWWLSVVYDSLSNFGGSAMRPLLLWAISIPCFAVFYRTFSSQSCALPERYSVSLFLSASNALPGASLNNASDLTRIISTCFNYSGSNLSAISLGYVGMLQHVWSIALLFLFGLGLRNLFRIK